VVTANDQAVATRVAAMTADEKAAGIGAKHGVARMCADVATLGMVAERWRALCGRRQKLGQRSVRREKDQLLCLQRSVAIGNRAACGGRRAAWRQGGGMVGWRRAGGRRCGKWRVAAAGRRSAVVA